MINFLPTSQKDMTRLGWNQLDIIIINGDAYVDHPAFGPILIARFLEAKGFKVGIISQPDCKTNSDFLKLGSPRLFFGISAGNMDSMINLYTAQKKLRSKDAYSPEGKTGLRPNRATIVYTQKVRTLFKDVPVVLGGIEASLRRIPHYDYWSNKLRNSILFDSKADILVYGMGEKPVLEIAERLAAGEQIDKLDNIRGTVVISRNNSAEEQLPDFSNSFSRQDFIKQHRIFEKHYREKVLTQKFGDRFLIHNPPAHPQSRGEMDEIYNIPFTREPHPMYKGKKIPAFLQIRNSVTSHRGCFGGCSFCAIGVHQGKTIQSRSRDSILKELKEVTLKEYFKGTISDIGGPTANMYEMHCKHNISETCQQNSCLFPSICPQLDISHKEQKKLLSSTRKLQSIKHVFVSSGIRFDLALNDEEYIQQLAKFHVSGLLKLAPEHKSGKVLKLMNKPSFDLYERFRQYFGTYC
ncbi:MAG: YgiQ family radical SAM protein, partial [Candidatus Cloacimonetes bacterium]|nr:YgiQ family radical SAM protein [Candidatus Cloacimonadota bacterium]